MSQTLQQVMQLVRRGEVKISDHGYDELAEDGIFVRDVIDSLGTAEVLEDYPGFAKGPAVLVLQCDRDGAPLHVVWGIPKGERSPAVLITAYRPDPARWTPDSRSRRT
jgi:hypothetical protein